mmetsp:Transcript_13292/g.12046  ORF Transcript_13292/g.12046 Transcript_13292/m.12046 type:complete len:145 (-) Transcript_13292:91-525(-)
MSTSSSDGLNNFQGNGLGFDESNEHFDYGLDKAEIKKYLNIGAKQYYRIGSWYTHRGTVIQLRNNECIRFDLNFSTIRRDIFVKVRKTYWKPGTAEIGECKNITLREVLMKAESVNENFGSYFFPFNDCHEWNASFIDAIKQTI